jgi:hypothetical protein
MEGLNIGLVEELCWSEVSSKTAKDAVHFLASRQLSVKSIQFALVLEVVRCDDACSLRF